MINTKYGPLSHVVFLRPIGSGLGLVQNTKRWALCPVVFSHVPWAGSCVGH